MNEPTSLVTQAHLPFYITAPGESDLLFTLVAIALVLVVVGFGALYFTIQAIPDRIAQGTSKAQMQVVGLLGLISLFTMNNLYWVAAILLAAIRIPDFMTPMKEIAEALKSRSAPAANGPPVAPVPEPEPEPAPESKPEPGPITDASEEKGVGDD